MQKTLLKLSVGLKVSTYCTVSTLSKKFKWCINVVLNLLCFSTFAEQIRNNLYILSNKVLCWKVAAVTPSTAELTEAMPTVAAVALSAPAVALPVNF